MVAKSSKPVSLIKQIEIKPEETAILVIDMQKDYIDDKGKLAHPPYAPQGLDGKAEMIANTKKLLAFGREKKIPIVYTVHQHRPDYSDAPVVSMSRILGALKRGSWGAEIIDELKPEANDYIVEKHRYSAFYSSDLDLVLQGLKTKTLVLTGEATNVCVESTARDAQYRGYAVVLLSDCTATFNKEMQAATLENVKFWFGHVMTSGELIRAIK